MPTYLNADAPLFRGLAKPALAVIERSASEVTIARSQSFFHQGQPADHTFYLVYGQVKLSQVNENGEQVTPRTVGQGKLFGGVAAFGQQPYPVSATAMSESKALRWSGQRLRQLMLEYPHMALNALDIVSKRLHDLQDRYHELATEQVAWRLQKALVRLSKQNPAPLPIRLNLSRQDLAEMIGTTLFTVSRVLKALAKTGVVELGREWVLVKDLTALEALTSLDED